MKFLRCADENEMLLCFLKGELTSARFRADLLRALSRHHTDASLLLCGDITDEGQNTLRKLVMGSFRGYPDREIFQDMPPVSRWFLAEFEAADLARIRYINDSYWLELSGGTRAPLDGARAVLSGHEAFGVSNAPFLAGADHLRKGGQFPPLILLTDEAGHSVILEGHLRMTVYGMLPDRFAGTQGYIGLTDAASLRRK